MAKKAVSLTLGQGNWLWLKGRAGAAGSGNLSETVDQLITHARSGRLGGAPAPRSVVGSIDLPDDDPALAEADAYVRQTFAASLKRRAPRVQKIRSRG